MIDQNQAAPVAGTAAQHVRAVASLDPATGELWAEYESTTPDKVQKMIRTARLAQHDWSAGGLAKRLKTLHAVYDALFTQRQSLAELVTRECGKPTIEALLAELMTSLDFAKYYLKQAKKLLRPQRWRHENMGMRFKRAELVRKPWGVVGVITPWNYPLQLVVGTVFPALLAGNSVVLKPAEYTTAVALRLAELLHAAGVPEKVFQVAPGDWRTGAALIEYGVDKIVLIGSERAGRAVARAAADRLIPVTLELGGSDPMLVFRDAPLDRAVASAIWGRFMNAGQTCVAVKRVYVEEAIFEPFVTRLVEGVQKLRPGRGADPDADFGPLIRESQVELLERQLRDAVEKGAEIRTGGQRLPELGPLYFAPTVLTNVTADMAVLQEETFGPLLPVLSFKSETEAIEMANASRYGLSASIWSRDLQRARRLALQIEAGSVTINDASFHPGVSDVPYGGFKSSGLGKSHGPAGLLAMVKEQYIDVDPMPSQYKPWWFGYSGEMLRRMDKFIAFAHAKSLIEKLAAIPAALSVLRHRNKI